MYQLEIDRGQSEMQLPQQSDVSCGSVNTMLYLKQLSVSGVSVCLSFGSVRPSACLSVCLSVSLSLTY